MEEITNTLSNVRLKAHEDITEDTDPVRFHDKSWDTKQKQLLNKLEEVECPISWKDEINEAVKEHPISISLLEDKYQEVEQEEGPSAWYKIVLKLLLCYCYFDSNDLKKAIAALKEMEELMNIYKTCNQSEELSVAVKNAVDNVVLGMKGYFKFYSEKFDDVEHILKEIKNESQMDPKTKAATLGIKAAILMEFPPKGSELAVPILKNAIFIDSDYAEWHFLLGKCLSRIRRLLCDKSLPSTDEILALRKATQIGNNATHMIFLAQTYRELAQCALFKEMKYLPQFNCSVDDIYKLSGAYYRKALQQDPENCSVNIRCSLGFGKFPHPYKDLELAKECAEKALKLAPNSPFVNEAAGVLYSQTGDIPKALECLKYGGELGSFVSYIIYVKLKFKNERKYDPLHDLQEIQKIYSKVSVNNAQVILCHFGVYYHYIIGNFEIASRYWIDAIHLDPKSNSLKKLISIFHKKMTIINIYEALLTETQKRIPTVKTADERSHYEGIIELCLKYGDVVMYRKESFL